MMQILFSTSLVSRNCMILAQAVLVPFLFFSSCFVKANLTPLLLPLAVNTIIQFQNIPVCPMFIIREMSYFDCEPKTTQKHITRWFDFFPPVYPKSTLSWNLCLLGSPDDFASPGYFSTNLVHICLPNLFCISRILQSNSIRVELTSTRRAALHRYTFPAGTTNPRILVDLTNDGQKSSTNPVMTLDPDNAQVQGGASFAASFGPGKFKKNCWISLRVELFF